jgi:hypothetical protein
MSTDPRPERTLGQLVASATQDISALVRSEIALAKAEVAAQAKKVGIGGALLAAAGVLAFYSVYFIFTTLAEGLIALGLARWLSYLIVTVLMLVLAGILALIGARRLKTVQPPRKAIATAQETVAGLKSAVANPGTVVPAPPPAWDRRVATSPTNRSTRIMPVTVNPTPSTTGTTTGTTAGNTTGTTTGSSARATGAPDASRDA